MDRIALRTLLLHWCGRARFTVHRIRHCRLLPNPHYRAVSIISKLAVNGASAIWGLTVLFNPMALGLTAYANISDFVPDKCLALTVVELAAIQTLWILRRWPPLRWGSTGYAFMLTGWAGIFYATLLADPPDPSARAGVGTILAFALVAFVTLPRTNGNGHAGTA